MSILKIRDEDGKIIEIPILKGEKGDKGDKGDTGNDYVLTDNDMNKIAALAAIKIKDENVIGIIDEDNNIILSGNLADGTYTLKYENEDGTYAEVGSLEVGAIPEPTNFADTTSEDWKTDSRLSGGNINTTSDLVGSAVTNYVPIEPGDTIKIEGFDFTNTNSRFGVGKADKTSQLLLPISNLSGYTDWFSNIVYDNNSLQITINTLHDTIAYMRASSILTGTAEDVVITITRNGTVL